MSDFMSIGAATRRVASGGGGFLSRPTLVRGGAEGVGPEGPDPPSLGLGLPSKSCKSIETIFKGWSGVV